MSSNLEVIKNAICNEDLSFIAQLSVNSKKIIRNLLERMKKKKLERSDHGDTRKLERSDRGDTRKLKSRDTRKLSKNGIEIIQRISNYLKRKTFKDILNIKAIFNLVNDFVGPNIDYSTCFNGVKFTKMINGYKKTVFAYQFMDKIDLWLTNLIENYPKSVIINGKKETINKLILIMNLKDHDRLLDDKLDYKQSIINDLKKPPNNEDYVIDNHVQFHVTRKYITRYYVGYNGEMAEVKDDNDKDNIKDILALIKDIYRGFFLENIRITIGFEIKPMEKKRKITNFDYIDVVFSKSASLRESSSLTFRDKTKSNFGSKWVWVKKDNKMCIFYGMKSYDPVGSLSYPIQKQDSILRFIVVNDDEEEDIKINIANEKEYKNLFEEMEKESKEFDKKWEILFKNIKKIIKQNVKIFKRFQHFDYRLKSIVIKGDSKSNKIWKIPKGIGFKTFSDIEFFKSDSKEGTLQEHPEGTLKYNVKNYSNLIYENTIKISDIPSKYREPIKFLLNEIEIFKDSERKLISESNIKLSKMVQKLGFPDIDVFNKTIQLAVGFTNIDVVDVKFTKDKTFEKFKQVAIKNSLENDNSQ